MRASQPTSIGTLRYNGKLATTTTIQQHFKDAHKLIRDLTSLANSRSSEKECREAELVFSEQNPQTSPTQSGEGTSYTPEKLWSEKV